MTEYKLPVEIPPFLGVNAELIPVDDVPKYPNGDNNLYEFSYDTSLVGYILGGIHSLAKNIF